MTNDAMRIEEIAPLFNTLLLVILLVIILFRKNGSGMLDPAEWDRRIQQDVCEAMHADLREIRISLRLIAEKLNIKLPFVIPED